MWTNILVWAVTIIVAAAVLAAVTVRQRKGRGKKKNFTEHTAGILRGVRNTGLYVNEQPEILMTFEAIKEDGHTERVQVRRIVPMTELNKLQEGAIFPVCYDPASNTGDLDPAGAAAGAQLQERFDRYLCLRNPRGLTYDQRARLRREGARKRAMLTDLRLTGEEEGACSQVRLTIRIDGKDGEQVLTRTAWMENEHLRHLTVGKLVEVSVVEDAGESEPLFSIDQDANDSRY